MNIISWCRDPVYAEFDTTLGGKLDSDWRDVFQRLQKCGDYRKSVVCVAGKYPEHIPAESIITIQVTKGACNGLMLFEQLSTPLPRSLLVIPTLVDPHSPMIQLQVLNLSQEDVWLPPRAQLGVLSKVVCIENDPQCAVKFQRIAASIEQVTVVVPGCNSDLYVLDTLDLGGNEEQKVQLKALLARYIDNFSRGRGPGVYGQGKA